MQIYTSYKSAFRACMDTQAYAIAHLHHLAKNTNIDTTGCYKIFFPMSGSKKFHIDNHVYDVNFNELFFINSREWHYFSHFDEEEEHERFVIFIYPAYLKAASSSKTELTDCFPYKSSLSAHNIALSTKEKERFLYYIHRLSSPENYGSDILDYALFLELMVFLNRIVLQHHDDAAAPANTLNLHNKTVAEILSYLDAHITEDVSINTLAGYFFLSPSYLCKTFKRITGTTIHKYITAQRITLAKDYLSEGYPIIEVGAMCGFNDYNAFLKAFSKEVGISPKKYSQFST
ncbi:AraC family transcriptional regulator [uncultured Acetatifactor sp.]|uniref:helix-turn-helix domain-containing protein n=1 Tax=uncultured Acetatifactor sp. TaxID=1671927 RepID=UPI00272BF11A|nr:AraC family transcriptional regulator [uncultured Acetatifactor sp.]